MQQNAEIVAHDIMTHNNIRIQTLNFCQQVSEQPSLGVNLFNFSLLVLSQLLVEVIRPDGVTWLRDS